MSEVRYICKRCGAESPVGIGYVLGPGEKPDRAEPKPGCPNPHLVTEVKAPEMRVRGFRMGDELHEAIADLAARNGRTIAEEVRVGMEAWLSMSGNVKVTETRRTVAPHANARPSKKEKKK